jgi:hypothetical protein
MALDYDAILQHIGQCGKWQWRNFFLLGLTSAAGGLAVVVWSFTAIQGRDSPMLKNYS